MRLLNHKTIKTTNPELVFKLNDRSQEIYNKFLQESNSVIELQGFWNHQTGEIMFGEDTKKMCGETFDLEKDDHKTLKDGWFSFCCFKKVGKRDTVVVSPGSLTYGNIDIGYSAQFEAKMKDILQKDFKEVLFAELNYSRSKKIEKEMLFYMHALRGNFVSKSISDTEIINIYNKHLNTEDVNLDEVSKEAFESFLDNKAVTLLGFWNDYSNQVILSYKYNDYVSLAKEFDLNHPDKKDQFKDHWYPIGIRRLIFLLNNTQDDRILVLHKLDWPQKEFLAKVLKTIFASRNGKIYLQQSDYKRNGHFPSLDQLQIESRFLNKDRFQVIDLKEASLAKWQRFIKVIFG